MNKFNFIDYTFENQVDIMPAYKAGLESNSFNVIKNINNDNEWYIYLDGMSKGLCAHVRLIDWGVKASISNDVWEKKWKTFKYCPEKKDYVYINGFKNAEHALNYARAAACNQLKLAVREFLNS